MAGAMKKAVVPVPPQVPAVPPLENGDRLTTGEFLRRYEAMPHIKKAELVEGVVYVGSPVRLEQHAKPDGIVQGWLSYYAARTPGTEHATNATDRLDIENAPQPNALLRILPECGGRSRVDEKGYLTGPPQLAAEVCASGASIDLHDKLRAYRRAGILEYLVWRTVEGQFDWFVLEQEDYRPNTPDTQGVIYSRVFPGLWMDLAALLAMDSGRVLDMLDRGLATPEHAAFVTRLKAQVK